MHTTTTKTIVWSLILGLGFCTGADLLAITPAAPYHRDPGCIDGNCPPKRETFGHYETRWRPWPYAAPAPSTQPPAVGNEAPATSVPTRDKELDLPKRPTASGNNPSAPGASGTNPDLQNVTPMRPQEQPLPGNPAPLQPAPLNPFPGSQRAVPGRTVSTLNGQLPQVVENRFQQASSTANDLNDRPPSFSLDQENANAQTIINPMVKQPLRSSPTELQPLEVIPHERQLREPPRQAAQTEPAAMPLESRLQQNPKATSPTMGRAGSLPAIRTMEPLPIPTSRNAASNGSAVAEQSSLNSQPAQRKGSAPIRLQVETLPSGEIRPGMVPATSQKGNTLRITGVGVQQAMNLHEAGPADSSPEQSPVRQIQAYSPPAASPRAGSTNLPNTTLPALFAPQGDVKPASATMPLAAPITMDSPTSAATAVGQSSQPSKIETPRAGSQLPAATNTAPAASPIRGLSSGNPLR